MRSFRYIAATLVITLSIFSSVLYVSCNKKCGSKSCQNGGTCLGDACSCPKGYSGQTCGTGWNDVFIGTYTCSRNSCSPAVSGTGTWISAVTRSSDGATISISNFDNANKTVSATVDSLKHLTIIPGSSSGVTASGNYASGTINLTFTTATSGSIGGYSCNMVMVKQ